MFLFYFIYIYFFISMIKAEVEVQKTKREKFSVRIVYFFLWEVPWIVVAVVLIAFVEEQSLLMFFESLKKNISVF